MSEKRAIEGFHAVPREELLRSIEATVAAAGVAPADFMRPFRRELEKAPDPYRAINNFHRFLSTGFSTSLIRDYFSQEVLRHIALQIFSQSQYLSDILVRNPELFDWLIGGVLKSTKKKKDYLHETTESITPFERIEKKLGALKRHYRREILRIGARDILGESEMPAIAGELSGLADSMIEVVLRLGVGEMEKNTGIREDEFAVIGLGKLGGEELNFSSDIDLMFVYDHDDDLHAPLTRIHSNHEFYVRLAEFVVRRLSEHSEEGHLYRVDMRLRPDGNSGPLAISRQAYHSYYEQRGELWERQMLLKARFVAGNEEVGRKWMSDVEPFVYPKTRLGSPLQEIAAIKRRIESRVEGDVNIKLGSGGIRDVEFVVQSLQLLHGGMNHTIREGNTLKAIDRLRYASFLSDSEQKVLSTAYVFLRTLEHRLQLLHGMQTHSLPVSADEVRKLSKSLAFKDSQSFERVLQKHRKKVRDVFSSVFEGTNSARTAGVPTMPGVWRVPVGASGFIEAKEAARRLKLLAEEVPEFQAAGLQRQFLRMLRKLRAPDWGLKNFLLLCSSKVIRRTLSQAVSKTATLELLVTLASRSTRMTQLLAREPLLFESLVARPEEFMESPPGWTFLLETDLSRFKAFNEFKSVLPFILGDEAIREATMKLTNLADLLVRRAFQPGGLRSLVLALGKYGGKEITVGSDLDLLFIYEDGSNLQAKAERAVRDFLDSFLSEAGAIYVVDFRLRPEGKSAPLATELRYYEDYLLRRADLWERQALLKARPVCGDEELTKKVFALIERHAMNADLPSGWQNEIKRMRKKMEKERTSRKVTLIDLKLGRGGLVDIEFAVQAMQLAFSRGRASLRPTGTLEAIQDAVLPKGITKSQATRLRTNYEYLRKLETFVRLNSDKGGFVLPQEEAHRIALAAAMGEKSKARLGSRIVRIRRENRILFNRILLACSA